MTIFLEKSPFQASVRIASLETHVSELKAEIATLKEKHANLMDFLKLTMVERDAAKQRISVMEEHARILHKTRPSEELKNELALVRRTRDDYAQQILDLQRDNDTLRTGLHAIWDFTAEERSKIAKRLLNPL